MTRKTAREIAIRLGFASSAAGLEAGELLDGFFAPEHYETLAAEDDIFSEYPDKKQMEYIRRLTLLCDEHRCEIDDYISRYAKGWKADRISKTALAVMRCALCEILFMEDIPNSAAINEAVELDKCFDEPEVVSFVNGVLGGFMRGEMGMETTEAAETVMDDPLNRTVESENPIAVIPEADDGPASFTDEVLE